MSLSIWEQYYVSLGNGRRNKILMKGRSVVGLFAGVMKGKNVSMDVKRGLRNSILLPTLTCGSKNWTWNGAQQSKLHAVEMSYLRGVCGMSRWDGLNNKSVYERCRMRGHESGVGWGVVACVKRSAQRWFSHSERIRNKEFVKVAYLSSVEGTNRRGRPLVDGKVG